MHSVAMEMLQFACFSICHCCVTFFVTILLYLRILCLERQPNNLLNYTCVFFFSDGEFRLVLDE